MVQAHPRRDQGVYRCLSLGQEYQPGGGWSLLLWKLTLALLLSWRWLFWQQCDQLQRDKAELLRQVVELRAQVEEEEEERKKLVGRVSWGVPVYRELHRACPSQDGFAS